MTLKILLKIHKITCQIRIKTTRITNYNILQGIPKDCHVKQVALWSIGISFWDTLQSKITIILHPNSEYPSFVNALGDENGR